MLQLITVTVALIALSIIGLAIRIIFVRDGKFPETHISRNPAMKRMGIKCVKTMDRTEQMESVPKNKFKNITLFFLNGIK